MVEYEEILLEKLQKCRIAKILNLSNFYIIVLLNWKIQILLNKIKLNQSFVILCNSEKISSVSDR